MKRTMKTLAIVAIIIFVVIQAIPVDRVNPNVDSELELTAPDEVMQIIRNSCYDCHSNQTDWPFYSYIAPVSWFVTGHVNHAREHLNFSEWKDLPPDEKLKSIEEIWEEISRDSMPLQSYLMVHPSSKLDDRQKSRIKEWTHNLDVISNDQRDISAETASSEPNKFLDSTAQ